MLFAADYPFLDILWTMLVLFAWVIWFWLLILVFSDLFSRHDISGWGKAGWIVLVVVLPYLGVFIYLIAQGRQMAERRDQQSQAARTEFDDYVKTVAAPGGAAAEIEKAKQLLDSGAITLAFTNLTNASPVIPSSQQQQIAQTLEDDAQVVSNTELDQLLADEPPAVREEILSINTDATNLALQVALLVPILAGLLGLFNSFRMMRLPDVEPSASVEAAALA
jgi:hypothetical protein